MESNAKRLYDHFIATNQIDNAKQIAKKYPHFVEKVKKAKKE
jgi:hypothetical protein